MKCQYCGREYVKNEAEGLEYLPEFIRQHIEYIPACDCLEKKRLEEMEEEKRRQEAESELLKVVESCDLLIIDDF